MIPLPEGDLSMNEMVRENINSTVRIEIGKLYSKNLPTIEQIARKNSWLRYWRWK
jgi:hypothetical protein